MSVSPPSSVRGSPIRPLRSRRGCKTCKSRRVKCGEEKPTCARCTKTGRKCEYEGTTFGTFSSAPATDSILDNPLSSSPNTVWRERRAFAYYFQHTALFVGGGLETDFWSTIVPQVSRSEPAVWDAIISLSALFESPEPCPDIAFLRQKDLRILNQNHRDALGWYSRSVSSVRQRLDRGDGDIFVGLVICVLFMCIEGLQGGVEQATRLYTHGVQLILTLRAQIASGAVDSSKAVLLENNIVPIFVRLGAIALNFSAVPVGALLSDSEHALTQGFASLRSAREGISILAAEAQLFQRTCLGHLVMFHPSELPYEILTQQATLLARLKVWHAAFTDLMESLRRKDALSPQQIGTGALLLTHHEMLFIMVATSTSLLETTTDAYLPQFQNIIEQAGVALDASARSDGSQPPLTIELSVAMPLWFTSLRCREPRLRRMALTLTGRAPPVQGFYKCATGVRLLETLIAVEDMYGMKRKTAQGTTGSIMPESTDELNGSNRPDSSSDIFRFDLESHPATPDLDYASSPYSVGSEMKPGTTGGLIPEEARIKPINIFRVQDGFPPGTAEEDIAKWSPYREQSFMHFLRNERDPISGTWHLVHGFTPIDY
ncbi:uncharacterized protein BO80DRAFT_437245 [Aspergillus ibericus CBS 121593]|uniref:Zn(2)-C6 fungal-type domain-containing protein n=1 Tax=Aspergillus ibericus CBS 121593 TaxID=1448316 RepID=A0A395GRG8_9EURO|nr:hypothetical protein BO80DRAFT_437245 [Aspergillus ibericus CBS 121593]RAK98151.1 hypothetical protein BO80DRAFT_437245 [Aspergillus ibericus CBS 121593]